jgi:preprotein translocase subunit SecE
LSLQENVQGSKSKLSKFLREVKAEFKKVSWPNKNELRAYTGVVFITVAVMVAVIWAMDAVLSRAISWVIRY